MRCRLAPWQCRSVTGLLLAISLALLAVLPACALATPSAFYSSQVAADAPAGYWRLEEAPGATIAADASGNGRTGDYVGTPGRRKAPLIAAATGESYSVEFPWGSGVAVPDADALSFSGQASFTLEAWLQPKSLDTAYRRIFSRELTDGAGAQGYYLWVRSSQIGFTRVANGSTDTAQANAPGSGSPAWAVGENVHVVATYDGTSMRLYVNGAQVATKASTRALTSASAPLWIAGSAAGTYLNAYVDEAAVYGSVLSADRVEDHYQAGVGAPILHMTSVPSDTYAPSATVSWDTQVDASPAIACSLDGSTVSPCSSPLTLTGLSTGSHTFTVSASAAGKSTSRTVSWAMQAPSPITDGYGQAVIADTPLGYWRLEAPAGSSSADSSGGVRPGTHLGSFTLQPALIEGGPGASNAIRFPYGSSLAVDDTAGNSSPFNFTGTQPFSIEAWVRPSVLDTTYRRVVSREASSASGDQGYAIWMRADLIGFSRTENGQSTTATASAGASPSWGPGVVSHLVGVFDGQEMRLYLNGELVASKSSARTLKAVDAKVRIAGNYNATHFLNGEVDETAIYDHALSAARVGAHYGARLVAPTVALTGVPQYSWDVNPMLSWSQTGTAVATTCVIDGQPPAACSSPLSLTKITAGPHTVVVTAANDGGSVSRTAAWSVRAPPATSDNYGSAVMADEPFSFWRLEEDSGVAASDAGGGRRQGTYGSVAKQHEGLIETRPEASSAVVLAGTSTSYVRATEAPDFTGTRPFALEAWVKPAALDTTQYRRLFSQEWTTAAGRQGVNIWLKDGQLGFGRWRDGTGDTITVTAPGIAVSQVAHVVGSYDGQTLRLYVNGEQVGSLESTRELLAASATLRIGTHSDGSTPLNASVDEVAVYDHALAAARVGAHYAKRLAVPVLNALSSPQDSFSTAADVAWATTGTVETTTCALDGASPEPCSSPVHLSGLAVGAHTLRITASNVGGSDQVDVSWTVRQMSPPGLTVITPSLDAADSTKTVSWTLSGDPAATVTCQLDAGAEAPCSSPHEITGLAIGPHTVTVRASNAGGTTKRTLRWSVYSAPEASFIQGPSDGFALPDSTGRRLGDYEIAWTATGGGASFVCRLDQQAGYPCESPTQLADVSPGAHTFQVTATNIAGASSASTSWELWGPPQISLVSGPSSSYLTEASVLWSVTGHEAQTTCTLDGAALAECESPLTIPGLTPGAHRFVITATNPSGSVTREVTWRVFGPPAVSITKQPNATDPTAGWTVQADGPTTVTCTLNGESLTPCVSPVDLGTSGPGLFVLAVHAENPAGQDDETVEWYEGGVPRISLTRAPSSGFSTSLSAEFAVTGPTTTIQCTLDERGPEACASPFTATGLATGDHTLKVEASNPQGTATRVVTWSVWGPPKLTVTSAPTADVPGQSVALKWTVEGHGPITQSCVLDGAPMSTPCSGGATFSSLAPGSHELVVTATSAGGADTKSIHWDMMRAPRFTSTVAPDPGFSRPVSVRWSLAGEPATVTCSVDGGAADACESPESLSALAPGAHVLRVNATNAWGEDQATITWQVWGAPTVSLQEGPPGSDESDEAKFVWTTTGHEVAAECSLDGGTFSSCQSPLVIGDLSPTAHELVVRTTNVAGSDSFTKTWSVMPAPPSGSLSIVDNYGQGVRSDAPDALWRLEESADAPNLGDDSGLLHGAVVHGDADFGQQSLIAAREWSRRSLRLDGGAIEASAGFDYTGPFTLEAWISDVSGDGVLFSRRFGADGSQGYEAVVADDTLRVTRCWNGDCDEASAPLDADGASGLPVAITFDGKMIRIYVDGEIAGSGPSSHALISSADARLWIGGREDGSGRLHAQIDEVAAYPTVLSARRVKYHADLGRMPAPAIVAAGAHGAFVAVNGGVSQGDWQLDRAATGAGDAIGPRQFIGGVGNSPLVDRVGSMVWPPDQALHGEMIALSADHFVFVGTEDRRKEAEPVRLNQNGRDIDDPPASDDSSPETRTVYTESPRSGKWVVRGAIYVTTDRGRTWTKVRQTRDGRELAWFGHVSKLEDGTLIASSGWANTGVIKSEDGGFTWTYIAGTSYNAGGMGDGSLSEASADTAVWFSGDSYFGFTPGALRSDGRTLKPQRTRLFDDPQCTHFQSMDLAVLAGRIPKVIEMPACGFDTSGRLEGLDALAGERASGISALDDRRALIVGSRGTILLTQDAGATWQRVHSGGPDLTSVEVGRLPTTRVMAAQKLGKRRVLVYVPDLGEPTPMIAPGRADRSCVPNLGYMNAAQLAARGIEVAVPPASYARDNPATKDFNEAWLATTAGVCGDPHLYSISNGLTIRLREGYTAANVDRLRAFLADLGGRYNTTEVILAGSGLGGMLAADLAFDLQAHPDPAVPRIIGLATVAAPLSGSYAADSVKAEREQQMNRLGVVNAVKDTIKWGTRVAACGTLAGCGVSLAEAGLEAYGQDEAAQAVELVDLAHSYAEALEAQENLRQYLRLPDVLGGDPELQRLASQHSQTLEDLKTSGNRTDAWANERRIQQERIRRISDAMTQTTPGTDDYSALRSQMDDVQIKESHAHIQWQAAMKTRARQASRLGEISEKLAPAIANRVRNAALSAALRNEVRSAHVRAHVGAMTMIADVALGGIASDIEESIARLKGPEAQAAYTLDADSVFNRTSSRSATLDAPVLLIGPAGSPGDDGQLRCRVGDVGCDVGWLVEKSVAGQHPQCDNDGLILPVDESTWIPELTAAVNADPDLLDALPREMLLVLNKAVWRAQLSEDARDGLNALVRSQLMLMRSPSPLPAEWQRFLPGADPRLTGAPAWLTYTSWWMSDYKGEFNPFVRAGDGFSSPASSLGRLIGGATICHTTELRPSGEGANIRSTHPIETIEMAADHFDEAGGVDPEGRDVGGLMYQPEVGSELLRWVGQIAEPNTSEAELSWPVRNAWQARPELSWKLEATEGTKAVDVIVDGDLVASLDRDAPGFGAADHTLTPDGIADGAHTWSVRVRNWDGTQTQTPAAEFRVDGTSPQFATGNLHVVDGSSPMAIAWDPASDTGLGLSHYEILVGGKWVGQTASTSWQFVPAPSLQVRRVFAVRAVDRLGNAREVSIRLGGSGEDDVPVADVDPPTPATALDDGFLVRDGSGEFRLKWLRPGTGEHVSSYRVLLDGQAYTTAAAPDGDGAVSFTLPAGAQEGNHSWSVSALLPSGRTAESEVRAFALDLTPPPDFTLKWPAEWLRDQGQTPPAIWESSTFTFGRAAVEDAPGTWSSGLARVDIYATRTDTGQRVLLGIVADPPAGTWTATSVVDPGEYRLQAVAVDRAGNERASSHLGRIVIGVDQDTDPEVAQEVPTPVLGGSDLGFLRRDGEGRFIVAWTLAGESEAFDFRITIDGRTTLLRAVTANSAGKVTYQLPDDLADGAHSISVRSLDQDGRASAAAEAQFQIQQPVWLVRDPDHGGDFKLQWTAADGVDGYTLVLDGQATEVSGENARPGSDGKVVYWVPANTPAGDYRWSVATIEEEPQEIVALRQFSIDDAGPQLTGINELLDESGEGWRSNRPTFSWAGSDAGSGIVRFRVELTDERRETSQEFVLEPSARSWQSPSNLPSGTYRIRLSAEDAAGNFGRPSEAGAEESRVFFVARDEVQWLDDFSAADSDVFGERHSDARWYGAEGSSDWGIGSALVGEGATLHVGSGAVSSGPLVLRGACTIAVKARALDGSAVRLTLNAAAIAGGASSGTYPGFSYDLPADGSWQTTNFAPAPLAATDTVWVVPGGLSLRRANPTSTSEAEVAFVRVTCSGADGSGSSGGGTVLTGLASPAPASATMPTWLSVQAPGYARLAWQAPSYAADVTAYILTIDAQPTIIAAADAQPGADGVVRVRVPVGVATGEHNWSVRARTQAGVSAASPTQRIGLDMTAPTAVELTSGPAPGEGLTDGTVTLTWAGSADAHSGVDHYEIASASQTWQVSAATTSWTTPAALTAGPHTLTVTAVDRAGNRSTATTRSFQVIQLPPAPQQVVEAWPHLDSAGRFHLAWHVPAGFEQAIDGYRVVLDGEVYIADGPAAAPDANGIVRFTLPVGIDEGQHSWTVRATVGSHEGPPSDEAGFSVDRSIPSQSALSTDAVGAAWSGPRPTISWTAATDADSGLSGYRLLLAGPTPVEVSLPPGQVSWTSSSDLADGDYQISLTAIDAVGNERANADAASFNVMADARRAYREGFDAPDRWKIALANAEGAGWRVGASATAAYGNNQVLYVGDGAVEGRPMLVQGECRLSYRMRSDDYYAAGTMGVRLQIETSGGQQTSPVVSSSVVTQGEGYWIDRVTTFDTGGAVWKAVPRITGSYQQPAPDEDDGRYRLEMDDLRVSCFSPVASDTFDDRASWSGNNAAFQIVDDPIAGNVLEFGYYTATLTRAPIAIPTESTECRLTFRFRTIDGANGSSLLGVTYAADGVHVGGSNLNILSASSGPMWTARSWTVPTPGPATTHLQITLSSSASLVQQMDDLRVECR